MEYKTEKTNEWNMNSTLSTMAKEGWKPIFMTPVVMMIRNPGGNDYPQIEFYITFEREIKNYPEK